MSGLRGLAALALLVGIAHADEAAPIRVTVAWERGRVTVTHENVSAAPVRLSIGVGRGAGYLSVDEILVDGKHAAVLPPEPPPGSRRRDQIPTMQVKELAPGEKLAWSAPLRLSPGNHTLQAIYAPRPGFTLTPPDGEQPPLHAGYIERVASAVVEVSVKR